MPDEQRYVISVMSVDRVGIIHDITEQILSLRGNIVGLSQTVMRGYFTVLVEAGFPNDLHAADVLDRLSKGGRTPDELQVLVAPRRASVPQTAKPRSETYVLTARGPDQPGIIHRIASFLAGHDVNFEDLYAYVDKGQFVMIAQATLPPSLPFERLQIDLEMLARDSEMEISLQHEDIFRAVNEVRMVGS
jgi:glycine cleavage system transcriptional repressor